MCVNALVLLVVLCECVCVCVCWVGSTVAVTTHRVWGGCGVGVGLVGGQL